METKGLPGNAISEFIIFKYPQGCSWSVSINAAITRFFAPLFFFESHLAVH